MINDQIKQHRKQYGQLVPRQNPLDEFEITAVFKNDEPPKLKLPILLI